MKKKWIISIVGRPNVGKSTLFNRLTGTRNAIVDKTPGITRDVIEGDLHWLGKSFTIVDTAGYDKQLEDTLKEKILMKILEQIKHSDMVIFVVDAKTGCTAADEVFADLLRKSGTGHILAVNKVDDFNNVAVASEFYSLGMGDPIPISAQQGKNVGDLLDIVSERIPDAEDDFGEDEDIIKIAIIGQPNAGKSSLLNSLLGYDRVLVHDVPGTTRDSIDTQLEVDGKKFILLDTAGIRKRFRRGDWLEKVSTTKALDAIDRCDVTLLVCDLDRGLTHQDKTIAGIVQEKCKGLIMVFNKIDLVKKFETAVSKIDKEIEYETPFLKNVPRLYISALEKRKIFDVLAEADRIYTEPLGYEINTSGINSLLQEIISSRPPVSRKGRALKIMYGTLASRVPPVLILFVNDPKLLVKAYRKYIENCLRTVFPFDGYPLIIKVRKK